jgi:DNA-binding FrmR family transcriptional regulator
MAVEQMTTHMEEVVRLKRIEGQIRGIQKMIEEKRYCIDILTQLASAVGAIKRVESGILERHLKGCVQTSFCEGSREDREKKIEEVIDVFKKFGR